MTQSKYLFYNNLVKIIWLAKHDYQNKISIQNDHFYFTDINEHKISHIQTKMTHEFCDIDL